MAWYDNNWQYRKKITVDASKVSSLKNGLISSYNFDANANDQHGSNNATVNGATLDTTNQKVGTGCYDFNGSSNTISFGTGLIGGLSAFSLSMWVNLDNLSSRHNLYGNWIGASATNSILTRVTTSGEIQYYIYANSVQYGGTIYTGLSAGQWYHLVFTYDGSEMACYVDATKSATTFTASGTLNSGNTEYLSDTYSGDYLDGKVDQVDIYNRKISQAEITSLNNSDSGREYSTFDTASGLNLTDYPVYADLSDFGTDFFGNVKSDGTDIVVTSSDGSTKLSRELVNIDTSGQTGQLHFKAPTLSSSTDTEFYIYYGYASASETNDTSTWNSSYKAVYHFEDNVNDSTSNANNGSASNITYTASDMGKEAVFNGTSGQITVGALIDSMTDKDNVTVLAKFKPNSLTTQGFMFEHWSASGYTGDARRLYFQMDGSGQLVDAYKNVGGARTSTLTSGQYYIYQIRADATHYEGFLDGDKLHTTAVVSDALGPDTINTIGYANSSNNRWYSGAIDEMRFIDASQDYTIMGTTYTNLNSPSTFYAVGTQESAAAAPTVITTGFANVEETTADVSGNVTDAGTEAITERGVVYGTSPSPVVGVDDTEVVTGTTGTFTANLTGLTQGQLYYARAYATNSVGTGYGSDVSFSTKAEGPTNFTAVNIYNRSVELSWTLGLGAEKTEIRRKEGSYPTDPADGDQVYFDTGTTVEDTGLTANTQYFYRAWGWDENAGYSDDYADLNITTLNEYTLTINNVPSWGGSVTQNPEPVSGVYYSGQSVELTAVPTEDYVFVEWTGDLISLLNPDSITMSSNKIVNANFFKPAKNYTSDWIVYDDGGFTSVVGSIVCEDNGIGSGSGTFYLITENGEVEVTSFSAGTTLINSSFGTTQNRLKWKIVATDLNVTNIHLTQQ